MPNEKISSMKVARVALALGLALFMIGCTRDPQREKQKYLHSGIQYLQKRKYEESILQFRNALKLDPHYVDAFYSLGQAYLSEHDYNSAYNAIQQGIALDPKRLDLRLSLAQVYFLARHFANAEEQALFILKKDPKSAEAYRILATSLLAQGKKERAIEAFLKVIDLDPNDPSTYAGVGLVEMSLRRTSDAEKHFQTAVNKGPHSPQAYLNLAGFYRLTGQPSTAEDILHAGIKNNPEDTALRMSLADLFYSQQKPDLAEGILRELRDRQKKSTLIALIVGNFYFDRGAIDKASSEYRRGLEIDPKNIDLQNRIVECYLTQARNKEAEALNNRILKQRPRDFMATLARGRILLVNGHKEEAISVLRTLVARSQDSPQAHYFLGVAYQHNEDLQQAKTEFQDTLRAAPGLLLAQHDLAELDISLGQFPAAQELAEQIVRNNPFNANERMLLGTVYMHQGQPSAAREQFSAARRLMPADPAPAFDLAQAARAAKMWDEAEKQYESALALNPRFADALAALAGLWVERNQRPKALALVQQHIATYPGDAAGHVVLGSIYVVSKDYELAKTEFQRATELDPKLVLAYRELGEARIGLGDANGAIQAYEKAAALEPNSAELQTRLANLYLSQDNRDGAEKHYRQALIANPNDAIAANNLAWVYLKYGGNLDIALGLAQKAKEAQPELVNLTDTLGWIQYRKGLYAGAVSLLQDCVTKAPQSPVYRYHLGMALLGNGDPRDAKAQLQTALRLKLTGEDAQTARQTLVRLN